MKRLLFALGLVSSFTAALGAEPSIRVDGWSADGSPAYFYWLDPGTAAVHFNASLVNNKKKGVIASCDKFMSAHVGAVENLYGGSCVLRFAHGARAVLICDDTAVGEFAMSGALKGIDPTAALIQFVADHCAGG